MNFELKKLQKMFAAVALGVLAAVPVAAQQPGAPVDVSGWRWTRRRASPRSTRAWEARPAKWKS